MKKHIFKAPISIALSFLVLASLACSFSLNESSTPTPLPSLTPYPTYTSYPTLTSYPTYTLPPPTATLNPTATPKITGIGEWLEGHFFSIKVEEVQTATALNGVTPKKGSFLLVNVLWKANDLLEKHSISGNDFELVDGSGTVYRISGMIYDPKSYKPFVDTAEYQKGKWVVTTVSGKINKD